MSRMNPRLRRSALSLAVLLPLAFGIPRARAMGAEGAAAEPAAPAATNAAAAASHDDGIPWFRGSVDEAFALAAREKKPVFLYWGAVWCPPCHYLRTKVFPRPAFQQSMRHVVPVYLDGDTEMAQVLAERFATEGYPTVIVFAPDGREVTRLPSMLPVDEFAEALDRALASAKPMAEVLAAVELAGTAKAAPAELGQLAFHSWDQDRALAADRRGELFLRLWRETPPTLAGERGRFLALALAELGRAAEADPPAPPLAAAERDSLANAVVALLRDPAARRTNLDLVLYQPSAVVPVLAPSRGPARDSLLAAWDEAAQGIEADATLTVDDRLSALMPRIAIARLRSPVPEGSVASGSSQDDATAAPPPLPADLVAHVRERIDWAGREVTQESELQAVMSTMAGLLYEAGLRAEARTLLSARMADTVAPYYYLSYLAGFEAEAGSPEKAVALYREAYATASGSMTRFRWGATYLRQAMSLTPDSPRLAADLRLIVAEVLASPDAFAGGNWARLQGLQSALDTWNTDDRRRNAVDTLRADVAAACSRFPDEGDDSQRDRCATFLSPAQTTAG
jgi:thiol-disulfide isomerase/thioredoxin